MIGGGPDKHPDSSMFKECRQLVEIDGGYELFRTSGLNYPRLGHSACSVGNSAIVVSGTKFGNMGTCEYLDIASNDWIELPTLREPRYYHSSCCFEGRYVYVFGGATGTGRYLSSIEMLEIGRIMSSDYAFTGKAA
jgi:hypothetical protein